MEVFSGAGCYFKYCRFSVFWYGFVMFQSESIRFAARRLFQVGWFIFIFGSGCFCFADFVFFGIPGTKRKIILEGKTKVHSAGLVEFSYPGFPSITLGRDYATAVKAPTRQEEFRELFQKATRSKNVEDYLEAARQSLRRGMLKEFYECCSAAYSLDPSNATVRRLIEARNQTKVPLGSHALVATQLQETTGLKNMKVAVSHHYVMFHDTDDRKKGRKKQTRAEQRLELLEQVYEAYFMKFAMDGVVLESPKEHMMVLLFDDEQTYLRYATKLNPQLKRASGFWSPKDNISVFFDQGTTDEMKMMTSMAKDLQDAKIKARGQGDSREKAYLANSFDLLTKISKEESDIEVVSHEATHQLAGNTGLMPRTKLGLRWAQEGLASYFETPAGAGWGGIGAVNASRLIGYRRVSNDPERGPLELLICDALFDEAANTGQLADAYGQAWALTHYLMENHFEKLVDYYRRCSDLQGDEEGRILRSDLVRVFSDVFGDIRTIERTFHLYMNTLKTDMDRMVEAMK